MDDRCPGEAAHGDQILPLPCRDSCRESGCRARRVRSDGVVYGNVMVCGRMNGVVRNAVAAEGVESVSAISLVVPIARL